MTISPPEREAKSKIVVDRDPVETSFEKWAKPGHFTCSSKRSDNNNLIWNLHADAHDFDAHTDLEDISRKVFSAHWPIRYYLYLVIRNVFSRCSFLKL
jgi:photosystem I P700 chlorophyll a apoprotein A1